MSRRPSFVVLALALVSTVGGLSGRALAGPPYRTDDPEPVDLGHSEFTTYSSGTRINGDTSGYLPGFEFNYGLVPQVQFHVSGSVAFDSATGTASHFGYSDTEFGFKARFIDEDKNGWRPQVAFYPMLVLPTGNQMRGLGLGHDRLFLPIWAQKSVGDWTAYGGGGLYLNRDAALGDKDYGFLGGVLQRKINEKLTLGGELFFQGAPNVASKDSTGYNLGGSYDFDAHNHLLFSAGSGLQNAASTNLFSWYIGWQITN